MSSIRNTNTRFRSLHSTTNHCFYVELENLKDNQTGIVGV